MTIVDRRSEAAQSYRHLYGSGAWKRLRLIHLRGEPLCRICGLAGQLTAATVVDHVTPHKGNPDLFFDMSNLQSLCSPCHDSTKQREERLGYNPQIGVDGRPVDPRHPGFA